MFMGMKLGYILKKSGSITWTTIATRTRSRLSRNINCANSKTQNK